MNRAERRRLRIKNKEPVLNIKAKDINEIKKTAVSQAADTAFIMMLSIPLIVLKDKYGFGKKRLEKFSDYVIDLYDSFDKGYVTFDDLISTLKDEVGISIGMKGEQKKMIYNSNNYRNAKRILSHYGRESQERQLIEEMAELTKALNKKWRFDNGFIDGKDKEFNDDIAEEMADVIIGIEQMIIAYNCRDKILETIDSKVKRTIERINRRRRI